MERGDIAEGDPSHMVRRAIAWLKKGLVRHGKPVTRWLNQAGEWQEVKGKTQLIAFDGWVGVLRPIWGSKTLKLVTVYQAESES